MFYPMFMMVLLTFIVGLVTMKYRFSVVISGTLHHNYFKLMEGQEVPEFFTRTTRCFNNMFEVPVLFYVACLLYIVMGIDSLAGLIFAWLFVLMRYFQALVHLTYNRVLHRMLFFWFAFLSAMGLWLNLLYQQMQNVN